MKRARTVDVRRTMRASLETGGVPMQLRYRPKRPRRPEIYVLCDVSTSVTSASVFFLSVLHALHDSFRKLRSFVFIERISEVTDVFEHERDFAAVAQKISSEGGVADVSGYTDYGRVWLEFLTEISDDLDPRSTVIVLGDARTNGREPHAEVFAQISERAGRLFWLNPEPKLYWNYGDSVMAAYERYCDGAFECWTTRHLENFVNVVAGGMPAAGGVGLRARVRGSSGRVGGPSRLDLSSRRARPRCAPGELRPSVATKFTTGSTSTGSHRGPSVPGLTEKLAPRRPPRRAPGPALRGFKSRGSFVRPGGTKEPRLGTWVPIGALCERRRAMAPCGELPRQKLARGLVSAAPAGAAKLGARSVGRGGVSLCRRLGAARLSPRPGPLRDGLRQRVTPTPPDDPRPRACPRLRPAPRSAPGHLAASTVLACQAPGCEVSSATTGGRSPLTRSARVTSSSTERRLARTAIQTSRRGSALPL